MKERSRLVALAQLRCPRCHEGKMFTYANPYKPGKMHVMAKTCPVCGQEFEPEPGFYYGAMYFNYGFGVLLFAIAYVVLEVIMGVRPVIFFSVYIASLVAFMPLVFRYSRVLYIYILVGHDKTAIGKHNAGN